MSAPSIINSWFLDPFLQYVLDPYRGRGTGAVQAAMEHPRTVRAEELGGGELLGHLTPAAALLPEHGDHFVTFL